MLEKMVWAYCCKHQALMINGVPCVECFDEQETDKQMVKIEVTFENGILARDLVLLNATIEHFGGVGMVLVNKKSPFDGCGTLDCVCNDKGKCDCHNFTEPKQVSQ
jgi:hypothetical protein